MQRRQLQHQPRGSEHCRWLRRPWRLIGCAFSNALCLPLPQPRLHRLRQPPPVHTGHGASTDRWSGVFTGSASRRLASAHHYSLDSRALLWTLPNHVGGCGAGVGEHAPACVPHQTEPPAVLRPKRLPYRRLCLPGCVGRVSCVSGGEWCRLHQPVSILGKTHTPLMLLCCRVHPPTNPAPARADQQPLPSARHLTPHLRCAARPGQRGYCRDIRHLLSCPGLRLDCRMVDAGEPGAGSVSPTARLLCCVIWLTAH